MAGTSKGLAALWKREVAMSLKRIAAVGAAALLLICANVGEAQAAPDIPAPLDGWCDQGEACLYYNSNISGAVYDISWNVSNYGIPSGGQPYSRFVCSAQAHGDGPLCSGAGQRVWNNAASVINRNGLCDLMIFYNSGYNRSYAYQIIPRSSWANLDPTMKNENASQAFVNC
jgi:hypothetical protein